MMEVLRVLRPVLLKTVNSKNSIHTSAVCNTIDWRIKKGLPRHKNAHGPLTDLPDFRFADGRPTPMGANQHRRMLQQQEYAKTIVQYCSEMNYAVSRRKKILADEEAERQHILDNRLKTKGHKLLEKS